MIRFKEILLVLGIHASFLHLIDIFYSQIAKLKCGEVERKLTLDGRERRKLIGSKCQKIKNREKSILRSSRIKWIGIRKRNEKQQKKIWS